MLFQTLGQLRGTALKAAQLLSMDTTLLPPGIRQELAKACHQALPLNRALVGRVFRQALGAEPESLFAQFESQAFAAASLGQVHRATLSGPDGAQPVAVKVQYPGIAATIASDMRLLRVSLQALGQGVLPLPAWPVVEQALQEIDATLRREVDYLHEAQELQWFATHAAMEGVHIPLPIASHTRTQVLTLQHLPGLHLHEWLATQPPQAVRNVAGQRLWDWFLHCAFQLGRIHADLHPGNVLFLPDGQIGLLDFGCTRRLSLPFRTEVRRAWSALLEPGTDACARTVFHAYQSLGLISANLKPTAFAQDALPLLAPMQAWQVEPFARMEAQSMFDFSSKTPPPSPPLRSKPSLHATLQTCPQRCRHLSAPGWD